jgi:hypothetical protein
MVIRTTLLLMLKEERNSLVPDDVHHPARTPFASVLKTPRPDVRFTLDVEKSVGDLDAPVFLEIKHSLLPSTLRM